MYLSIPFLVFEVGGGADASIKAIGPSNNIHSLGGKRAICGVWVNLALCRLVALVVPAPLANGIGV